MKTLLVFLFLIVGFISFVKAENLDDSLAKLKANREAQDKRDGIAGKYDDEYQIRPLQGEDLFQSIRFENGILKTVPHMSNLNNGVIVMQTDTLTKLTEAEKIRTANGGIYPFTVVSTPQPFIITNKYGDIVIVGVKNPPKKIESQQTQYRIEIQNGNPVLVQTLPQTKLVEVEWLDIKPVMPSGVPDNLLQTQKSYTSKEIQYIPNSRYAYRLGCKLSINQIDFQIYKYNLQ